MVRGGMWVILRCRKVVLVLGRIEIDVVLLNILSDNKFACVESGRYKVLLVLDTSGKDLIYILLFDLVV